MALVAVLVPVVVLQSRRLEQRIDAADAIAGTRTELAEMRRDLHALAERVARIEGALTGPWRPTKRLACSEPKGPSEAASE